MVRVPPITFKQTFEPSHDILSNVRADIRKYVVSWLKPLRESNRPVAGSTCGYSRTDMLISYRPSGSDFCDRRNGKVRQAMVLHVLIVYIILTNKETFPRALSFVLRFFN